MRGMPVYIRRQTSPPPGPNRRAHTAVGRLMIEKLSGRVAYAVMSFGSFLGMGGEEHAIPWSKLTYDTRLDGYQTDISALLRVRPALMKLFERDARQRGSKPPPSLRRRRTGAQAHPIS